MSTLAVFGLVALCLFLTVGLQYLDAKYQLKFTAWFNGTCSNPFEDLSTRPVDQPNEKDKDQVIAELSERVEVLEKIVTEPAYELNKKINSL